MAESPHQIPKAEAIRKQGENHQEHTKKSRKRILHIKLMGTLS